MEKAYKFRIYPNKTQENLIRKTFGCKRYVYNTMLAKKIAEYKDNGKTLSYSETSKILTEMKRELEWLREPDKCALQNALKDLEAAYKKFFNEHSGFPKFKSKKSRNQSYKTNFTNGNIEYLGTHIKLPKLGKVKIRDKQIPKGRILSATISQVPSGKYFVSLCCTDVSKMHLAKTSSEIGIDVGLKDYIITSSGNKYENPRYLKKSLERLAFLQRSLSRKTRGSANWEKARLKVAKLQEHIANQRNDYLQKVSTKIIRENDKIFVEDLKVSNMLKNHHLARSISDASWGLFFEMLTYKARWYGRDIVQMGTFYPSSQICSDCGEKIPMVKDLSVRKWKCPCCGKTHDRDINAALNILNEGQRLLSA